MTRPLFRHNPDWQVATLEANRDGGVIIEVGSGSTPPTEIKEYWDGHYPWLTPKEMTSHSCYRYIKITERTVTEEGLKHAGNLWPNGTVMLTKRAPVGAVAFNDVPMAINQGILAFRCGERLLPEFLYYWFRANGPYLNAVANGSTYPELYPGDLFEIEIALPSIEEQRVIVNILRILDDKIELNQKIYSSLGKITQAIYKSWFIDFDPVRAKAEGRVPEGLDGKTTALFPSNFEMVDEQEVPIGWTIEEIRDRTTNIQYGLTRSASWDKNGPKFLRITDIQGGKISWSRVPHVILSNEEFDRYRLADGDIVVARTGASTGENLYLTEPKNSVFASYLVRFQFNEPGIGRIVGCFMRSSKYFDYIAGSIGGSAQPNASAQTLAMTKCVFPTIQIANKFFEIIHPLDKLRTNFEREVESLTNLRETLLPKLISGNIRITNEQSTLEAAI